MTSLTIGQLARKAQVNVETVRYYERQGLMPEPPRRESGYREYTDDAVSRLQFIKRAQPLGFSLNEISELLSLRADSEAACADVKRRAQAKIADVEAKIRSLQAIKEALSELAARCDTGGATGACPILETLEARGFHTSAPKESKYRETGG